MKFRSSMRGNMQRWGAEVASTFEARWWGFFLAALILAAAGAEFVYVQFDLPQRYSELIVGAIAWNYGNKFHDYAVVHGPIASSMVALVFIGSLAARLKRDFGTEGVDKLHDFVFLLLRVPAGGWLAGVLSSKSEALALLHVAQLLILSGLLIGWCLSAGGAPFWARRAELLFRVLQTWMLVVVMAALAVSAIAVAVNRVGGRVHATHWMSSATTLSWTIAVFLAAVLFACVTTMRTDDAERLRWRPGSEANPCGLLVDAAQPSPRVHRIHAERAARSHDRADRQFTDVAACEADRFHTVRCRD